ncbi:ABC transporter permease [Rheinheimera sp. SA_1]|uniref:ABC transporter permease n=1 Tax=Rheinheimera sp. SA_1 TaxID=1827365 RepID=UPI0007FC412C|nr:ABC transporter permease [Rheinheimera sp. SA_1]OBP13866.1 ABC transporter permease [Rheinheimera sp. SA_1]
MLKNYLLIAWRIALQRKLFTVINLLCISLTLLVLLVLTALLENTFAPTGVEGKSPRMLQIVTMVSLNEEKGNFRHGPLGYKVITDYIKPLPSAELVAAVSMPESASVYQQGRITDLLLRRADAAYWQILDFEVLDGRVPTAEDVAAGRFVLVLNQSTATQLFGKQSAVGQQLNVGGQQFTVIGVVADVLQLNSFADMWAPVSTYPSSDYQHQLWGNFSALILARSAADFPALRQELATAVAGFKFDDPLKWQEAKIWADSKLEFFARMLLQNQTEPESGAASLLLLISLLMLLFMLLPALNLVNLNTGRMMERSTEIGVRKAFGASRQQLIGQFLVENLLLCCVGGLLGLAMAAGTLELIEQSGVIPYLQVEINLTVFALGMVISMVFGLLSGIIPAWRIAKLDPVHALKGARR